MLKEIVLDSVLDSVRLLPFLFLAFLILEWWGSHAGKLNQKVLVRFRKAGPLIGALLGIVPQCGIPVLGVNLFTASLITPGTLFAVFLSASDEALLILLGTPGSAAVIPKLIVTKVIIAILCGYGVDFLFANRFAVAGEYEEDHHGCGCGEHRHNIFLHALQHTAGLFLYIFLFTLALHILLEVIGFTKLASLLLKGSLFQPVLTAVIGLIPSCASSILLTNLYVQGILNFASLVSGLCTSTGVGLAVLFKVCPQKKDACRIAAALWGASAVAGIVLQLLL